MVNSLAGSDREPGCRDWLSRSKICEIDWDKELGFGIGASTSQLRGVHVSNENLFAGVHVRPSHTYRYANDARGDGTDTNAHQSRRHRVRDSESCRRAGETKKNSQREHGREAHDNVSKHGRDRHRRRLSRGDAGGAKRKETGGAESGGELSDFSNPRKEVRSHEQAIEQRDGPTNERTNANGSM